MKLTSLLLLNLLTSIVFLTQVLLVIFVHIENEPTKNIKTIEGVQIKQHFRTNERIFKLYMFEVPVVVFSCLIWLLFLLTHIFKPRLSEMLYVKATSGLVVIWKICIFPLTTIVLAVSVYAAVVGFDEINLHDSDMTTYMNSLIEVMKHKTNEQDFRGVGHILQYIHSLQRSYHCCGISTLMNLQMFASSDPGSIISESIDPQFVNDVNPWKGEISYIPTSCIDSIKSTVINQNFTSLLQTYLSDLPTDIMAIEAPIYSKECSVAISEIIKEEMKSFWYVVNGSDVLLSLALLIFQVFLYQHPIFKTKSNTGEAHIYVSNKNLLTAIQGTQLLSKPTKLQRAFGNVKPNWVEHSAKVGWCLGTNGQQHCEYLRRIYRRQCNRPGQIKTSAIRRFLRTYLPLIEAIVYSDGDVREEVEANDYYGGYIVMTCRVLCCALYGLLGAKVFFVVFLTGKSKKETDSSKEEIVSSLNSDLNLIAGVLVRVTFVVAAVISKRFRCFLTLLGPTLGLTAGQSFLAAELTSVTVGGPIRGIIQNVESSGETLSCLMKLSSNITRDANKLLKPSGKSMLGGDGDDILDEDDDDEDWDEDEKGEMDDVTADPFDNTKTSDGIETVNKTRPVKYPKLVSFAHFNTYFVDVLQIAVKGIKNSTTELIKLTELIQNEIMKETDEETSQEVASTVEPTDTENGNVAPVDATQEDISKKFQEYLDLMDTTEKNMMQKKRKAMKSKLDKIFKNVAIGGSKGASIREAVERGSKIDSNMRRRLTATCMTLHQTRAQQCTKSALQACSNIHKLGSYLLVFNFIGPWCAIQVNKGTACPTSEALEKATVECGKSGFNIGIKDGFGAQFTMVQSNLDNVMSTFDVDIGHKKVLQATKSASKVADEASEAISQLMHITRDLTKVIFSIVLLLVTLLKLFFILLIFKTQAYITNFLTDMDFDNIYIESVFEAIDERRKSEERMYLLPLKFHERKSVFWRRKKYTPAEMVRALINFIKYSALGIAFLFMFFVDEQFYHLLRVLDIATQGDLNLEGKAKDKDINAAVTNVAGDGFAAELLKGVLTGLTMLMDVDLDYKLSHCSPNVIASTSSVRVKFGSIWFSLLLLALGSGYLLRMRHMVLGFFYPAAYRRRQIHLYNSLLANRQRFLSTNRNLIIHRTRENQLQKEVRQLSKIPAIVELFPKLGKKFGLMKGTCVICRDVMKSGPNLFVCSVDGCAMCRQCQRTISDDPGFCIACLDRKEDEMEDLLKQLKWKTDVTASRSTKGRKVSVIRQNSNVG